MDSPEEDRGKRAWWPAALLVGAVLAAFSPAMVAEFVTWDDRHNLFANERMNPPTLGSVMWYWGNPYKDLYVPVTYTVWSALAAVAQTETPDELGARLNPYIFHLFNILLHAGSALAAYALLRSLSGDQPQRVDWPAWAGAMVFALHPVQVESVAWVSGMKDVLAGMLSLIALWQYVEWARGAGGRWWLATICFLLAMLAKPSAVVAPAMAAVVGWMLLGTPWRSVGWIVGTWLVLAIPIIVIGKIAQPARDLEFVPAWWARPVVALDALAFYFGKIVAPIGLGIDYARSPAWLFSSWQRFVTWIVPVVIVGGAVMLRRRMPALLAGVLVMVAALLPVLGLVPFDFQGYSTVTDHYLYLAMIGPAIVMAEILRRSRGHFAWGLAGVMLVALGAKTFAQCMIWKDSGTLFEHTVAVNPKSVAGNVMLGNIVHDRAEAKARAALRMVDPSEQLRELMNARSGLEEAARLYRVALEARPNDATVHLNLGNTLLRLNRHEEAAEHYRRVLSKAPDHALARQRLEQIEKELAGRATTTKPSR